MNVVKLATNAILFIAVVLLSYKLYAIIQEPIEFEKEKDAREKVVIKNIEEIKEAQLAYKDLKGHFANDWNKLLNAIKNDSLLEIKITGNPDDSMVVTTYDTFMISMIQKVFPGGIDLAELPLIPFSEGERFAIAADKIDVNRVKIPVFEVKATQAQYLKGMNEKYIEDSKALILGSLTEGRYTGNWE